MAIQSPPNTKSPGLNKNLPTDVTQNYAQ